MRDVLVALCVVVWASLGASLSLEAQDFLRGDANDDGIVDINDVTAIASHVALGAPIPPPLDRADCNDNEFVTLSDAVCVGNFVACGGSISAPSGTPGADPDNSMGNFGGPQSGYAVHFEVSRFAPTAVELTVTVDTAVDLSAIEFTLQFDSTLKPRSAAFAASLISAITPIITEDVEADHYTIRISDNGCSTTNVPMIAAGTGRSVGRVVFDQTGTAPTCPSGFPLRWIPDTIVNGQARRAALVSVKSIDYHPSATLPQCIPAFLRGDANDDGIINVSDVTTIATYVALGGPVPAPLDRADCNDDEFITLTDALCVGAFFACGNPIPAPSAAPGLDPDESQGTFGSEQPGHAIEIGLGRSSSAQTEFTVAVDTPVAGRDVLAVEFTVRFDPALANPSFVLAASPPVAPIIEEVVASNVYSVRIDMRSCNPVDLPLLTAGPGRPLGSIAFDRVGTIATCPASFPLSWVADTTINGQRRRAAIATTDSADHHPSGTVPQCVTGFVRGEVNGDQIRNLSDVISLLNYFALDGATPVNCDGADSLDAADVNDNEHFTIADPLLLAEHLACGGSVPLPEVCAPDPTGSQQGFDVVDPAFAIFATAEVTAGEVLIFTQLRLPPATEVRAATFVLEFDPSVLSPAPTSRLLANPCFISAPGVDVAGTRLDDDHIVVTVQGLPGTCRNMLPAADAVTNLVDLGRFSLQNVGGASCARIATSTLLVPEHTLTTGNGIEYRSTIVTSDFADHHPGVSPLQCEAGGEFIRADSNGDGQVDISDPSHTLNFLFSNTTATCLDAADSNDDGDVDVSDPSFTLGFLFLGRRSPSSPYPGCGPDATADCVDCSQSFCP